MKKSIFKYFMYTVHGLQRIIYSLCTLYITNNVRNNMNKVTRQRSCIYKGAV